MMKGYRTLALSLAVAIVGVLQTFDWATVIPGQYAGPALLIIGAASAALRFITTTPVGTK